MSTVDFITNLFCKVDDAMPDAKKHSQASLYPSEVVTIAILFALKGVGNRAFYRWLERIALNELKDQQRALKRRKRDVAREVREPTPTRTSYPDLMHRLTAADGTPSKHVARGEAVAVVLDWIDGHPRRKGQTLVVVVADHGEGLVMVQDIGDDAHSSLHVSSPNTGTRPSATQR